MPVGANPKCLKLDGTVQETTWDAVLAAVDRMKAYFRALKPRFIERDALLDKILMAMMLREHVMVHGDTGTAKSAIVRAVFGGIEGATVWRMDLARTVTDAQLFGPYDVQVMRKRGAFEHMTEGNMPEANFAELGEFFDASDFALRSLLGALNERQVRRGPQVMDFPLITCVADSNFAPEDLTGRAAENLRAVIDRFMFHHKVDYVMDPTQRTMMARRALDRVALAPLPPLSLQDVELVSGVILWENLVQDPYLVEAYQASTFDYATKRKEGGGKWLSDRRYCRGLHVLEASALLHGRIEATFEDLAAMDLCLPVSAKDAELLAAARNAQVASWIERAGRREIEQEQFALAAITGKIPTPEIAMMGQVELDQLRETLAKLREELTAFKPTSVDVGSTLVQALEQVANLQHAAELRLIDVLGANLPTLPDPIPAAQLSPLMRQANLVEAALLALKPGSPDSTARHGQALIRARQTVAAITVEFVAQRGAEPEQVVTPTPVPAPAGE